MYKRSDREFVFDMLFACERILEYTHDISYEDFKTNSLVIDAVVRNIEILGEAAKGVSAELVEKYPNIEWKAIARTRDKIIHFYFGIDINIIWDIIQNDLPVLKSKLENLISEQGWK